MGWLRELAGKQWEPQQLERLDDRIAALRSNGQTDQADDAAAADDGSDIFGFEPEAAPAEQETVALEEVQAELARTTLILGALTEACIRRGIFTREQLASLADGSASPEILEPAQFTTAAPSETTESPAEGSEMDFEFGEEMSPDDSDGSEAPFPIEEESAGGFDFPADESSESEGGTATATAAPPRKKKKQGSLVRQLVGVFGGGIVGLTIGYFIILWVGGDDFLDVGPKLPAWLVPAKYHQSADANEPKVGETNQKSATGLFDDDLKDKFSAAAGNGKSGPPPQNKKPRPKNKPVTETPLDPFAKEPGLDIDDPSVGPAGEDDLAIDDPLADPLPKKEPEAKPEPTVEVVGAEAVKPQKLGQSLKEAQDVLPDLVDTDVNDAEVRKKKSAAYAVFARLGHDLTFVEATGERDQLQPRRDAAAKLALDAAKAPGMLSLLQRAAVTWFGKESGRDSPGILLAGKVEGIEQQGDAQVMLVTAGSQVIPVVTGVRPEAETGDMVVVLGSIVENAPANVTGYAGEESRVVFAKPGAIRKLEEGLF